MGKPSEEHTHIAGATSFSLPDKVKSATNGSDFAATRKMIREADKWVDPQIPPNTFFWANLKVPLRS